MHATTIAAGILAAAIGAWAVAPLAGHHPAASRGGTSAPSPPPGNAGSSDMRPNETAFINDFDRLAFDRAALWNPAPAPEPAATEVEEPTPRPGLEVDLIAIISEGSERAAAVYDRREDRIRIIRVGDHIGRFEVAEIRRGAVRFSSGGRDSEVRLDNVALLPAPADQAPGRSRREARR